MGTLSVDKLVKTSTGAAEFTLPATDGTAGQSIQTDGSGQLSFGDVSIAAGSVGATEIATGAVGASEIASTFDLSSKTLTIPDGFTLGSTAITATGTELNTIADQYSYMTIWVDAGAMVSTTTAGADANTNEYGTNDVNWDYLAFDTGATEEQAQFKIVMPETWDLGTIKAKFYWSSASGSTAGDTVEWGLKGRSLSDDDAIDSAFGTEQVITDTVLAGTNGDIHVTAATPAITIGNTPALNDVCAFEVHRNTDGTDDMAEDAWLFGILLQIRTTSTVTAW